MFKYRSIGVVVGPAVTDNDSRGSGTVTAAAYVNNWIASSLMCSRSILIFTEIKFITVQFTLS